MIWTIDRKHCIIDFEIECDCGSFAYIGLKIDPDLIGQLEELLNEAKIVLKEHAV